jgi:hypothetical protein
MFVVFFLLLVGGIVVKLQFAAIAEAQKQLHLSCLLFDHHQPPSGLCILRSEVDFLVEFDLGRYFGLILVAGTDSEVLLFGAQDQPIPHLLFVLFVDDERQILLRDVVAEVDGLVVLDGHVEFHIIAFDFDEEERVFKISEGGLGRQKGLVFWVLQAVLTRDLFVRKCRSSCARW